MKNTLIALVLLASVAAVAQTTTFKSARDGFQITAPTAKFGQVDTSSGTTADGFPFTTTAYAGTDSQGDYIVEVTTYDRDITKDRLIALANSQKGEIYMSKNDLEIDGQYAVLRMVRVTEGGVQHKMANWITAKGNKFYQIIFGSDRTAEQLDFDKMNAFQESFKFYGCFLPEGCK